MAWRFTDFADSESYAVRLRRKRFQHFLHMVRDLPRPITVLDVGGTEYFWQLMGVDLDKEFHVTLLNIIETETQSPHLTALVGDARNLSQFADDQFDVVFSNSVIEHVGDLHDQQRMAEEIRRVGKYYYLQTPNRNFPIEPHFQFPFFQFVPNKLRLAIVRRWSLGWYPRAKDRQQAQEWIDEIRLMTKREVKRLFPRAAILPERFVGLAKSWIAIYGPEQATSG
jgi:hypothetical protein